MGFWAAKLRFYIHTVSYLSSERSNTFWCLQKAASPNPAQGLSSTDWCNRWVHAVIPMLGSSSTTPEAQLRVTQVTSLWKNAFCILFRLKDQISLPSQKLQWDLPRCREGLTLWFCVSRHWCSWVLTRVSASHSFWTHIQHSNALSLLPLPALKTLMAETWNAIKSKWWPGQQPQWGNISQAALTWDLTQLAVA